MEELDRQVPVWVPLTDMIWVKASSCKKYSMILFMQDAKSMQFNILYIILADSPCGASMS